MLEITTALLYCCLCAAVVCVTADLACITYVYVRDILKDHKRINNP